ncbi:hypothetical protein ADICYQ_5578 [Cyclobacterium qasimii M12-11B]|uniref:Uncharacterized protein n=1 Tax=Cyclobacterium qasimii M12-11B TaxID=641524 RepID=S7WF32_9BACT|nr:hypothetical protein ADICYQ_5578 [Cyclobacterium qasimii M12-11B]
MFIIQITGLYEPTNNQDKAFTIAMNNADIKQGIILTT